MSKVCKRRNIGDRALEKYITDIKVVKAADKTIPYYPCTSKKRKKKQKRAEAEINVLVHDDKEKVFECFQCL